MVVVENQCCDCATDTYPCLGKSCHKREVKIYKCDQCQEEVDYGKLFHFDEQELCIDCISKLLEKVK